MLISHCPAIWFRTALVALALALAPATIVPGASAEREEGKITMSLSGMIGLVQKQIESQTGDTVIVKGEVVGKEVSLIGITNRTTIEVLDILANQYGWIWWQRPDGIYEIMDQATYKKTVLVTQTIPKTFRPVNRTSAEIRDALKGILTPEIGTIFDDPTTNKVIVNDLPERIAVMQELVDQLDVPLVTRIFQVRFAQLEQIEGLISPMSSDVGTITSDDRTHQIIVRDLIPNIKQMELMLMAMDVGPVMEVYEINNIGPDGETFQDLVDALSEIVTDETSIKAVPEQGRIYIEDVPEVHDKVVRLLKVFDQPVKQVKIEAEVVEVTLTRDFLFGVEMELSGDMETAVKSGVSGIFKKSEGSTIGFSDLTDILPFASSGATGLSFMDLGDQYAVNLRATLRDQDTRVLLRPRVTVKNHELVTINVGASEPIASTYQNNSANTGYGYGTTVSQQSIQTGLIVDITPSISNSGLIEMEVDLSNSTGEPVELSVPTVGTSDGTGKFTAIRTFDQSLQTTMIVPSGKTRVIGGLIRKELSESRSGVPLLRNIPYLGALFGSYTSDTIDLSLLFFITPTIVEELPNKEYLAASRQAYGDLMSARASEPESSWASGPSSAEMSAAEAPSRADDYWLPAPEGGQLPGAALSEEAAAFMDTFKGVKGADETGPLSGGALWQTPLTVPKEDTVLPPATLSDSPAPAILQGGSLERAFGDREIVKQPGNYQIDSGAPSGSVTPAERSTMVRPPAAPGKPAATPAAPPSHRAETPGGATPPMPPPRDESGAMQGIPPGMAMPPSTLAMPTPALPPTPSPTPKRPSAAPTPRPAPPPQR